MQCLNVAHIGVRSDLSAGADILLIRMICKTYITFAGFNFLYMALAHSLAVLGLSDTAHVHLQTAI